MPSRYIQSEDATMGGISDYLSTLQSSIRDPDPESHGPWDPDSHHSDYKLILISSSI